MEIIKFERRPFEVEGVQVTEENIAEVAEWCGGDIRHSEGPGGVDVPYIKVKTHRPLNEKQKRAYLTDWILRAPTGLKVYTNQAMENSFTELRETRNIFEDNREAVYETVLEIVEAQVKEVSDVEPIFKHPSGGFTKFIEEE